MTARAWMAFFLTWMVLQLAMTFVCAFLAYRNGIIAKDTQQRVDFIAQLVTAWGMALAETPEEVRRALVRSIALMTGGADAGTATKHAL